MFNVQGGRKPCDAENKQLDNLRMTNETKGLKYSTFFTKYLLYTRKRVVFDFFATIFNYTERATHCIKKESFEIGWNSISLFIT